MKKFAILASVGLLTYFAFIFGIPRALAAIAYVNTSSFYIDVANTVFNFPALSVTTGNTLVVYVRNGTDNTTPTITDTAGNTFTEVTGAVATRAVDDQSRMWVATNVTGNAADVVHVTFGGTVNFIGGQVRQYSGVVSSSPSDAAFGTSGGPANTGTSPSFTTTQADEVVVACVTTVTPTENYSVGTIGGVAATNLAQFPGADSGALACEDRIVSSIQTNQTATINWDSAPASWYMSGLSLMAASDVVPLKPRLLFLRGILKLLSGTFILR
ncbi:hypothetical protein KW790_00690 [Candidatus Parcubacteria bacterium]|nr:hypothetical protein [Candidatus Parcubacteria bacterium]